jgi:toxin ParE1/3/4
MRPVEWSDKAQRDYLEIVRYIAADNPAAAEKVADAVEKAGNDLGVFATGRPGRVTGTYEKVVSRLPYLIVYAITGTGDRETITILRVIHAARNWPPQEWPE